MNGDIKPYSEILKDKYLEKLKRYCAYRDRCHQEVMDKIRSFNIDDDIAGIIVSELITEGYLNEERYAKSFVRGKYRINKWGRNKIIQNLKQKNISRYLIDEALKEIIETEYLLNLKEILHKKNDTVKAKNKFEKRKKLFVFAYNKGYEAELINDILDELILY